MFGKINKHQHFKMLITMTHEDYSRKIRYDASLLLNWNIVKDIQDEHLYVLERVDKETRKTYNYFGC